MKQLKIRPSSTAAIVGSCIAMTLSGTASAATLMPVGTLTTVGQNLNGASLAGPRFVIDVAVPNLVKAKLFVDGSYVGTDGNAPFSFVVTASVGRHKAEVRTYAAGNSASRLSALFTVVTTPTQPPVPTPPPTPSPVLPAAGTGGPSRIVTNGAQLQTALSTAVPGERIVMSDGIYTAPKGQFEAAGNGTANAPITLAGSRSAVLTTSKISSGGYGLHVTGSHWFLQGFSVTNSKKGIVLDGSVATVIDSVDVGDIGQEGIHFRDNSADDVLRNSTIHDTGKSSAGYGEGVYVGSAESNWASYSQNQPDQSDRVTISDNRITNTAAEGIDIKEGTSDGRLLNNVFKNAGYSGANFGDSWVDVKGDNYLIQGNSGSGALRDAFQVHSPLPGWGLNNLFIANSVLGGVPGYLLNDASNPMPGGNVVSCTSDSAGATMGLSNLACR